MCPLWPPNYRPREGLAASNPISPAAKIAQDSEELRKLANYSTALACKAAYEAAYTATRERWAQGPHDAPYTIPEGVLDEGGLIHLDGATFPKASVSSIVVALAGGYWGAGKTYTLGRYHALAGISEADFLIGRAKWHRMDPEVARKHGELEATPAVDLVFTLSSGKDHRLAIPAESRDSAVGVWSAILWGEEGRADV